MMKPNTNYERVDALTHISNQIYPILEHQEPREISARRLLRLGVAGIATALRGGDSPSIAGSKFDTYLSYELRDVDFGKYEPYRTHANTPPHHVDVPMSLGRLANNYGNIQRMTYLTSLTREPDSVHALHLTALAVPYARAHYPDLDSGKVALYGPLHDILEAYTGDFPTFAITPEDLRRKKIQEENAHRLFTIQYGHDWPELVAVVEAYETLADDEAAFVKTMDKNDPGYTHFRNDAYALKHEHGVETAEAFYNQARINTLRTLGYASRFALVLEDKDVLNEHIAALFDSQNETTPIVAKS